MFRYLDTLQYLVVPLYSLCLDTQISFNIWCSLYILYVQIPRYPSISGVTSIFSMFRYLDTLQYMGVPLYSLCLDIQIPFNIWWSLYILYVQIPRYPSISGVPSIFSMFRYLDTLQYLGVPLYSLCLDIEISFNIGCSLYILYVQIPRYPSISGGSSIFSMFR